MRLAVIVVCLTLSACGGPNVLGPSDRSEPQPRSGPTPPISNGVAHGIVSDPTGTPIMGATVEWAGPAEAWGDRGDGVQTDQDGFYKISVGPLGGVFWMRATKRGYTEKEMQVRVDSLEVNFVLAPKE